jgi:5-hydroxyisourate hydrolase-like protein (transthyretin family)
MHRAPRAALTALAVTALSLSLLPVSGASAATVALQLFASSADGGAFDFDEYTTGDISVQLRQGGQGIDADDASDLAYYWMVEPFEGGTAIRVPQTGALTQATDVAGAFAVDLPTGHPDGKYVLYASLGGGAQTVPSARILSFKAGQASLTFDDGDSQERLAGQSGAVKGSLTLADGTGLANRLVDLSLEHGAAGTDPGADAGFTPAADDADQSLREEVRLTTNGSGQFQATLSDPAEQPQGSELGGSLLAVTGGSDHGNAGEQAEAAVDFVVTQAPDGALVHVTPLGSGTPGQQLTAQITVTAPDNTFDTDPNTDGVQGDADSERDVVQGLRFDLALDHGFFTPEQAQETTEGTLVGALTSRGAKAHGFTNANGQIDVFTAIGRDKAFDADGTLTATLSGQVGGLAIRETASWSTADPLNGRVELRYTPRSRQEGPVNPALVDARVYLDAFALDQFGNPVNDQSIDLTYGGYLADYDYSEDTVTSDFDTYGDFWVTSFVPGTLKVTGTWPDAPVTTFNAQGEPESGTQAAAGSAKSTYYRVEFAKSKFKMTSSASDVVPSGDAVSHTVKATDQHGNPVRGSTVRFYRTGPDRSRGEAVRTLKTNVRGEATYTFVTAKVGRSVITAEITDGVSSKILRAKVKVGLAVTARISKGKSSGRNDKLTVRSQRAAAGAKVFLYRVDGNKLLKVKATRLNQRARANFTVRDRNGKRKTTYVAVVRSTSTTAPATTRRLTVR